MVFPFLLPTMASAALAQGDPVNMAGYPTVSLYEAGLSRMPDHPPSGTETSPACARVVRREGQTTEVQRDAPPAGCPAIQNGQPSSNKAR